MRILDNVCAGCGGEVVVSRYGFTTTLCRECQEQWEREAAESIPLSQPTSDSQFEELDQDSKSHSDGDRVCGL